MAYNFLDMECKVYMVNVSYQQKPCRFRVFGHGYFDMSA